MSKKMCSPVVWTFFVFVFSCYYNACADDSPVVLGWYSSCQKNGYSWLETSNNTEGSEEWVDFSITYSCRTGDGIKDFMAGIFSYDPVFGTQEYHPYVREVGIYLHPNGSWEPALDEQGIPVMGYAMGTTGGRDFCFVVPEHNLLVEIDCETGTEYYYYDEYGDENGTYYGTLRHHGWGFYGNNNNGLIRLETTKTPSIEPDYMNENDVSKYGYYTLSRLLASYNHVTVTLETLPSSSAKYGTDYHLWWGYEYTTVPYQRINFIEDNLTTSGPNTGRVIIPSLERSIKIYVIPKWDNNNEGSESVDLQIRHVCDNHLTTSCSDKYEFDDTPATISIVDPQ